MEERPGGRMAALKMASAAASGVVQQILITLFLQSNKSYLQCCLSFAAIHV